MKELIEILEQIETQSKLKKYETRDKTTKPSDPEQSRKLLAEPEKDPAVEILELDD